jgi:pimeloyl-ACP methyl ester carboxylesterase
VLLIHGFASDSSDWAGWPDALAEAGRASILVDLPGHGSSPAPADLDDARTSRVVEAIAAVTQGPIDVVAYSLGARLAWELPRVAPVRRLVLGGLSPLEPFGTLDFAQVDAFVASGEPPTDPMTGMLMGLLSAPGRDAAALALVMRGLAAEPFEPTTPPAVPTLFVAGSADPMTGGIDSLEAITPRGRLLRVPGDHAGALRSPEFRAAALAFLAG